MLLVPVLFDATEWLLELLLHTLPLEGLRVDGRWLLAFSVSLCFKLEEWPSLCLMKAWPVLDFFCLSFRAVIIYVILAIEKLHVEVYSLNILVSQGCPCHSIEDIRETAAHNTASV